MSAPAAPLRRPSPAGTPGRARRALGGLGAMVAGSLHQFVVAALVGSIVGVGVFATKDAPPPTLVEVEPRELPADLAADTVCDPAATAIGVSWVVDTAAAVPPVTGVDLVDVPAPCAALPITVSVLAADGSVIRSVTNPALAITDPLLPVAPIRFDFTSHPVPIPPIEGIRADVPDPVGAPAPVPAGTDVTAVFTAPGGTFISANFDAITAGGGTVTVTTVDPADPGYVAPEGFVPLEPAVYFDLSTTASFTPPVVVCATYPEGAVPDGTVPRLFHRVDDPAPGAWVDETVSYDTTLRQVCGEVDSFSPFSLGVALDPGPAPTVVLTAPASPTAAAELAYTLTFSEPVTGLAADDLSVTGTATGCTIGEPAGVSETTYTVALTGCSEGTVTLRLRAAAVRDADQNLGPAAPALADGVIVDRTGPAATLACIPGEGATNAAAIDCAVTFTEVPAAGSAFAAADLLVSGTSAGWTVGPLSGSGTGPYAFTLSGAGTANGTLSLAVAPGAVTDATGNPTTASATLVWLIDRTAPVATAPLARPQTGARLAGTAAPLRITWSAADNAAYGFSRYELARSLDGGKTWTVLASSLAVPSYSVTAPTTGTVRFRARAVDAAGNASAWAAGPAIAPRLVQDGSLQVWYRGIWYLSKQADFSGGTARWTRNAGTSTWHTFTGRSVALVTTTASTRGMVRIFVDGNYVTTVDLRSATTRYRVVAWEKTWPTAGTHRVTFVNVATSGRPRFDLDALVVIR